MPLDPLPARPADPLGEATADAPAESLYRSPFVGRAAELRQLRAAFDATQAGHGSLVAVLGEPGIGKTALCDQLTAYAVGQGGRTLVGHCYEAGSLTLPYLPFVQALRQYVQSVDTEQLREELGGGAPDVARIVPDLRQRLSVIDYPPGDPQSDRWRLLEALADFLRAASDHQPMLLLIEDLHDADSASLDVLVHLSRVLHESRLLVVATYRDVEVDRAHPLSAALSELRRASAFVRLPLRGLGLEDVQHLLAAASQHSLPAAWAELVHHQTEGNPLFVQELLRYLVDQGFWETRPDGLSQVGPDRLAVRIPEGLRDVIGKRLSRLGERTSQVLAVASVLGPEFQVEVLLSVALQPEDDIIAALEEAARAALIEERPAAVGRVGYRFTHAFFRQTRYEELSALRRMRWHQQVGRALEALYAHRLDEHAAELAEHFLHSSAPDDLRKAVGYAEIAAMRAMGVYAYGEAARHLERALEAQQVFDPDDWAKRCDLLLALGQSLLPTDQLQRVPDSVAAEAFSLAEAHGDSARAARAAIQALDASQFVATQMYITSQMREWVARADRHAALGTVERVQTDLYRGRMLLAPGSTAQGHVFLRQALERAREMGDEAAFAAAAGAALTYLQSPGDVELTEGLARELTSRSFTMARSGDLAVGLLAAGRVLLAGGNRDSAEWAWQRLARLADEQRSLTAAIAATTARGIQALVDGRLEEAVRVLRDANAALLEMRDDPIGTQRPEWRSDLAVGTGRRAGAAGGLGSLAGDVNRLLLYLGWVNDDTVREREMARTVGGPPEAARMLLLASLGRCAEAVGAMARLGDVATDESRGAHIVTMVLEASVLCRGHPMAEALVRRLAPFAGKLMRSSPIISYGRLLGEAATMLGRPDEARSFYVQGLAICEQVRFRPELALIRLDLAELLLASFPDDRDTAFTYLDDAIQELDAMRMQPGLDRALTLQNAHAAGQGRSNEHLESTQQDRLTAREREVVVLVARGLSNREIAEALVITEGTAEVHVKHILSKLGFKSRSQVAAWMSGQTTARQPNPQTDVAPEA